MSVKFWHCYVAIKKFSDYRESTVNEIGVMLLSKYLLPFEIVSILLLAALIGAAMLSRKKVD